MEFLRNFPQDPEKTYVMQRDLCWTLSIGSRILIIFGNTIYPKNVPLYWKKNGADVICLIQFAAWSTICWILKSFNYRQESSNLLNNCIICPFFALRKEIEACSTKKSNLLARLHGFCQVEQKSQKRSLRLFYYLQ